VRQRILITCAKSLIGPVARRALELFGIRALETEVNLTSRQAVYFWVGRDFAGSEPGARSLLAPRPAIRSGRNRRSTRVFGGTAQGGMDRDGIMMENLNGSSAGAHRVRGVLRFDAGFVTDSKRRCRTSLVELWGLGPIRRVNRHTSLETCDVSRRCLF